MNKYLITFLAIFQITFSEKNIYELIKIDENLDSNFVIKSVELVDEIDNKSILKIVKPIKYPNDLIRKIANDTNFKLIKITTFDSLSLNLHGRHITHYYISNVSGHPAIEYKSKFDK